MPSLRDFDCVLVIHRAYALGYVMPSLRDFCLGGDQSLGGRPSAKACDLGYDILSLRDFSKG